MLAWLLATALGADLAVGEPTDTRRYKIEAFGLEPTVGKRYDLDWLPINMLFWSGLIECTRTGKRTDSCTFVDGKLEFGFVVRGEEQVRRYEVAAPEKMELAYTKFGKVKIDLEGDMKPFWKSSADALLGRYHKPDSVRWLPDQWREIGTNNEDDFRYWFGGAMEVQLPKDPTLVGWKVSPPLVAQTWAAGTLGGQGETRVVGTEGSVVMLSTSGRFGEQHSMFSDYNAKGEYEVVQAWDSARGTPVAARTVIQYEVHMAGYFTKRLVLMSEAQPGMSFKAGELDGSPLAEGP